MFPNQDRKLLGIVPDINAAAATTTTDGVQCEIVVDWIDKWSIYSVVVYFLARRVLEERIFFGLSMNKRMRFFGLLATAFT